MGQNKIQAFATDSSANVLTDDALASRSELQTGFPLKSKADSALIGKLMQNATAGAYAVGEFSAKYGTTDITGNDATGFATAFESALESYIGEKAPTPDLSIYATKENATLTGTATLNGQNIATEQYVDTTVKNNILVEYQDADHQINGNYGIANISYGSGSGQYNAGIGIDDTNLHYGGSLSLSVLDSGNVEGKFYVQDHGTRTGIDLYKDHIVFLEKDKTTSLADLARKTDIPSLDGYLTETDASSNYLTITSAQNTYQPKGDYATNTALNAKADASALASYAPLASPALTGTATLNGNTIATTNQVPAITSSTTDLEAGVSALATGAIYLVYE